MEATLDRGNALEREPHKLGGVPDWFNASRQSGWARFQELSMPSRRDEEWRFASLGHLDFEGARFPDPQSVVGTGERVAWRSARRGSALSMTG